MEAENFSYEKLLKERSLIVMGVFVDVLCFECVFKYSFLYCVYPISVFYLLSYGQCYSEGIEGW